MALLAEKQYPQEYPKDAIKVLSTMSFSKGKDIKIVGSQALKSQLYAGDYDVYEIVKTSSVVKLVKDFQDIIKNLKALKNVYIGDIKAGVIKEWQVLGPHPTKKIESLLESNIISSSEATEARNLLKGSKAKAKQELKFHIIRWTPEQILAGKQTLRDGRTYTLAEAFQSPTITKLDVIALVGGHYTDFSIIYEFHLGNQILNKDTIDPEASLKESIKLYKEEGNRFKVIKRKFSLAKLKNNQKDLQRFHTILNSEAGKLYTLYSDVKTLADLLDSTTLPTSKVKEALKGFKARLETIYSNDLHLAHKTKLLNNLRDATSSTALRAIESDLFAHLNKATELRGGYAPI